MAMKNNVTLVVMFPRIYLFFKDLKKKVTIGKFKFLCNLLTCFLYFAYFVTPFFV